TRLDSELASDWFPLADKTPSKQTSSRNPEFFGRNKPCCIRPSAYPISSSAQAPVDSSAFAYRYASYSIDFMRHDYDIRPFEYWCRLQFASSRDSPRNSLTIRRHRTAL